MTSIKYNDGEDRWEGLPSTTTVTDSWTLLILDNGNQVLSFGGLRKAGEDVHILDATGKNLQSWCALEWGDEPEAVMGAIVRAAAGVSPAGE